jgi:hypothetical protein
MVMGINLTEFGKLSIARTQLEQDLYQEKNYLLSEFLDLSMVKVLFL